MPRSTSDEERGNIQGGTLQQVIYGTEMEPNLRISFIEGSINSPYIIWKFGTVLAKPACGQLSHLHFELIVGFCLNLIGLVIGLSTETTESISGQKQWLN